MKSIIAIAMWLLVSVWVASFCSAESIRLEQLDLKLMITGSAAWPGLGHPQKGLAFDGKPLSIGGVKFEHGVGTHAVSSCFIALDGKARSFTASVGIDDEVNHCPGTVEFIVVGDGKELWRSGVCGVDQKPRQVKIDLSGLKVLELEVTDAENGNGCDDADWANAVIEYDGEAPHTITMSLPPEQPVILTPPAPASPRINGPAVYALGPGHPFILRVPATGDRPMTFGAKNLPAGLTLDANTGIITGSVAQKGTYKVTLSARNKRGKDKREVRIVVGDTLSLTPYMGWNTAYCLGDHPYDKDIRFAVDQMVKSGMADYGYQYVCIDDYWSRKVGSNDPELGGPTRDANGQILPNKRFPDMKALTEHIHAYGLRAGIYSSPGPNSCGGCETAGGHEAQDLQTIVDWGFDFLKYDQCSYHMPGYKVEDYEKPYKVMGDLIKQQSRDIVLNLCQYGNAEVWKWGPECGNSWRTTTDLGMIINCRLPGFYYVAFNNARHWQYARPGAWNDPDYILLDKTGWPTSKINPSESYAYMSIWSLMDAPLIYSGDMSQLDAFTLNVLCNHEIIAVNQDPLGKQAKIARNTFSDYLLVKDMEDGSKAAGVFNLSWKPREMTVKWNELGVTGKQRVRDLWRQQNIGVFDNSFTVTVPAHGVSLISLHKAR